MGGLDTVSVGAAMPPQNCVKQVNLLASEMGLRSRLGYREWATGLTGSLDGSVRSVLPFSGSAADGSKDRLFVTTSSGIWDVSAGGVATATDLAFGSTVGAAGRGVCHAFVNTDGAHFLLYADEVNGYHVYTESTDTWAEVASGGGGSEIATLDPRKIAFVMVWKNRVWFVERDSSTAWYLGLRALYGTPVAFRFGSQFKAGGTLVGLWSWTGDGGAGIDDQLVAVSSSGDVVIYQGTDPSSADSFGLRGVWYVGGIPSGRKIAKDRGGELLILSGAGAVPISVLVGQQNNPQLYPTRNIANLVSLRVSQRKQFPQWALAIHPEDNSLLIMVPTAADAQPTEQLAMSLSSGGWGRYEGLPIYSADSWGGKLYFGTADGRVCVNDGYLDGTTLANEPGDPVTYSFLGAFQSGGSGLNKQIHQITARVLSESTDPALECEARFDFNLADIASTPTAGSDANAWDEGEWDSATWADEYTASQKVFGATGIGTYYAIAVKGRATSRTVLVGFDVLIETGGV